MGPGDNDATNDNFNPAWDYGPVEIGADTVVYYNVDGEQQVETINYVETGYDAES